MFKLPILILTYNRPKHLSKLLSQLKKIRPYKIYVSCDGPKNKLDRSKIKKINSILNVFDKDTKIIKKFYKKNKGIMLAPQTSLSWFFKKEKMGIILEDDCIPTMFFFKYMQYLLIKFKNNKKIFAISGYNPFGKSNFGDGFYFISNYFLCWGWGSWSRSWENSEKNLRFFLSKRGKNYIDKYFNNKIEIKYWKKIINLINNNFIKTWAFYFLFSVWKNKSYCILPNFNLVENIGFDNNATTSPTLKYRSQKSIVYNKKILDPSFLKINEKQEKLIFKKLYNPHFILYPYRILYLIKYFFFSPRLFFLKTINFFKNYINIIVCKNKIKKSKIN